MKHPLETRPYETNWPVCGVARKWVIRIKSGKTVWRGVHKSRRIQVVRWVSGVCV